MAGIIGRKLGMTQIFSDAGAVVPVTVVEAGPCPVVQILTADKNGYNAVQLGFGAQKPNRTPRAELGHAVGGSELAPRTLREFPVDSAALPARRPRPWTSSRRATRQGGGHHQGPGAAVKRHGFRGRPADGTRAYARFDRVTNRRA
jgi:large subunit ribosomal protein L3